MLLNFLSVLPDSQKSSNDVQDDPSIAAEIWVRYPKDYFCFHYLLIRFIFCSGDGASIRD